MIITVVFLILRGAVVVIVPRLFLLEASGVTLYPQKWENTMKNHEGYHDPTAFKAIRRAKAKRKKTDKHLYFKLRELVGMQEAIKQIER